MNYRNRIRELRSVAARDMRPHPLNARRHGDAQRAALRALLGGVGIANALLAYETPDGLMLIDGHARQEEAPDQLWPVLILDVDDAEANALLAALDRVGALADVDPAALVALLDTLPSAQRAATASAWTDADLAALITASPPHAASLEAVEDTDGEGSLPDLVAPFPYFGGKARVAARIWARFGDVANYVEPFCGSAAVLLAAPSAPPIVTLNDADGFIANFWRAVAADPDAVAAAVDWPVNEIDLFARHVWLIEQSTDLRRRLEADPDAFDAQIAGWWCWGACAWIGTGWCSGEGPWMIDVDGVLVNRKLPHLGDAGRGVNRKLPHLGDAGRGVNRQLPHLGDAGRGVNRQLPHLGNAGRGVVCTSINDHLRTYMARLADALRTARVTAGDWARVCTPSVTTRHGLTAVLLDPPYGEGAQDYSAGGNADKDIAAAVWAWAQANGDDPLLRIAVCGYDDGRATPPGWSALRWTARKGYQAEGGASADKPQREMIWFSPHCVPAESAADG